MTLKLRCGDSPYLCGMKYLLSVLCFFFLSGLNAQSEVADSTEQHFTPNTQFFLHSVFLKGSFDFQKASEKKISLLKKSSVVYAVNHLPGLFCRLEHQLERKSKLAPRFRLGSLQYTEWMEGKRDLYSRYLP